MCGIAGFVGQGNEEILRKMTGTLKHRGPDDEGYFIDPVGGIFLGHQRLSIIDLACGRQPIFNEYRSICVIFNGEIYNFQELRAELEKKGHKFNTRSDTEVIVHSYEEKGDDFIKDLNGMFTFALWDNKIKKLILGRDRIGEKPLYYSLMEKTLIFGSEPKAVLAHPKLKRELNLFSLAKYLNYEYVPGPETIYKGILKLGPGEYLVYTNGDINIKKYWEIKFQPENNLSEKEILYNLDRHMERSVKMRMVSDVPLGVWLSGGLDSTSIAYYAQKNSDKPIKTFSIGFSDKSFDESKYAREAADFLKTDHYEKILTAKECLDLIPQISDFLDEPFADASVIPTYLLAKFSRGKVKVGLGGDGGDELFMGYPTFQAHKLAKFYKVIPQFFRNSLIEPIIRSLPASSKNISLDFKLKRFISGFEYSPEIRDQIWMGSFQPKDFSRIFSAEAYQEIKNRDIFSDINNYLSRAGNENPENRLIYLYLKN
ncbi:MAG: asparagine synthase (glutamine-hydrolyzing), partial [Candidatus Parcubacteria bacterium]|nr:asparagine synthase (glutamine-hydrolyzing) [Candidatus Parcubacteria bacterium]